MITNHDNDLMMIMIMIIDLNNNIIISAKDTIKLLLIVQYDNIV